ncbi:MAG: alpha/beta hydrolase [Chitinophagales bacterium]
MRTPVFIFISVSLLFLLSCKSKLEKKDKSLSEMQQQDEGNYKPVLEGAYAPVYKSIDSTDLHINIFFPEGYNKKDSLPCIVYFFGGAFIHGSPAQFEEHCKYFAARGIVAATADYRVISRNNCTAIECVKDAKSCIRWLRQNADSLGIDATKIIMGGGSAGGFLCLTAAIDNAEFEELTDDKTISCVPDAMVLINPVVNSEEFDFRIKKFPGKAAEINPIKHVVNNLPPAIVFHGTEDKISGFSYAKQFVEVYKKAGNEIELHSYEGMEHGFAQRNKNDGKYFKETLQLTDDWLLKLGYLPADKGK